MSVPKQNSRENVAAQLPAYSIPSTGAPALPINNAALPAFETAAEQEQDDGIILSYKKKTSNGIFLSGSTGDIAVSPALLTHLVFDEYGFTAEERNWTRRPKEVDIVIEVAKLREEMAIMNATLARGAPAPATASPVDVPATHRDFGKPSGAPLIPSYIANEYQLSSAYLSRHLHELKDKRIKVGRTYAYSFRDITAMSRRRPDPPPPNEETMRRRANAERAARNHKK